MRRKCAGRNTYKPYPCGVVLHPGIDACLQPGQSEELIGLCRTLTQPPVAAQLARAAAVR